MKRKLVSSIITGLVVISMSVSVFAGSASQNGMTSGGSKGKTTTSASVSADKYKGTAYTSAGTSDKTSLATTIIYYYINERGQQATSSSSGTSSATAGNTASKGQKAVSQHKVTGGTYWGNWSCSLTATS